MWEDLEEEEEEALHGGQYQAIMHDTWHEGMTVTQGAAPHRINLQSGFLRQIVRISALLMPPSPSTCPGAVEAARHQVSGQHLQMHVSVTRSSFGRSVVSRMKQLVCLSMDIDETWMADGILIRRTIFWTAAANRIQLTETHGSCQFSKWQVLHASAPPGP